MHETTTQDGRFLLLLTDVVESPADIVAARWLRDEMRWGATLDSSLAHEFPDVATAEDVFRQYYAGAGFVLSVVPTRGPFTNLSSRGPNL